VANIREKTPSYHKVKVFSLDFCSKKETVNSLSGALSKNALFWVLYIAEARRDIRLSFGEYRFM
jgi:hypothetical protein